MDFGSDAAASSEGETSGIGADLSLTIPVLLAESVMTLKTAKFLFIIFRLLLARFVTSRQSASKRLNLKTNVNQLSLQLTSYSYAETLLEVRLMIMLSLVGVLGIHWLMETPTGKTPFPVEITIASTVQLFLQWFISSITLFFPDAVTDMFIKTANYPITLKGFTVTAWLLFDCVIHIANSSFLATVSRNKAIAVGCFLAAAFIFRILDKALLNLGNALRVRIAIEEREEAEGVSGVETEDEQVGEKSNDSKQAELEQNDSWMDNNEDEDEGSTTTRRNVNGKKQGKKKKKH